MKYRRSARYFFLVTLAGPILACARAFAAPVPVSALASIDEKQAQNGDTSHVLQVLSYHQGQSRGGGLFVWTSAATSAPDNCVTFAGKGAPAGRWIRQLTGALDATMCGAYWDDAHDDAAVLTRAFAA